MANDINDLLPEKGKPSLLKLVIVFFITTFMAATQDIAVDGWALTLLRKFVFLFTYTIMHNYC